MLSYTTRDVQRGILSILIIRFLMVLPLDREDSLFTLFALPVKSSITLGLCKVRA